MNDNKKYLIMLGSITGVILFLMISVLILSSCSKTNSYNSIEKKLVKAAQSYIEDEKTTVAVGNTVIISADELVTEGYIKSLDKLKNDNCTGSVTVYNNGEVLNYVPNLSCTNYKTMSLKERVIEDNLVSSKDGLYADAGEYIFKGKNPNNHLTFAGQDWLIIKIDANGNLKLVSAKAEGSIVSWDNKFNEETEYMSGENEYATSYIKSYLAEKYDNYKDSTKKHLIPFALCTGSRERTNLVISSTIDCATKEQNQYVGLINPTDYAKASYDNDCKTILSGSCMNYNYFDEYLEDTWTANAIADSTSEAILYTSNTFRATLANEPHKYHLVVYISGNELYNKGDGSANNPYVIK